MSNIAPQMSSAKFTLEELSQIGIERSANYAGHTRKRNASDVAQETTKRWIIVRPSTSSQQSSTHHVLQATSHHVPILVPRTVLGKYYSTEAHGIKQEAGVLSDGDLMDWNVITDYPDSPLLSEIETYEMGTSPENQMANHQFASFHNTPHDATTQIYATPYAMYMQNEYENDLQFQKLLTTQLSHMNDNMKAHAKYQIQKILLEARYGHDFGQSLSNEEMPEESQE